MVWGAPQKMQLAGHARLSALHTTLQEIEYHGFYLIESEFL